MPVEAGPPVGTTFGTLTLTPSQDSADVGQSVRLTLSFLDGSAAPIDPVTCTLTLTLPDASTVVVAIGGLTRTSQGVYVYDYVTTLPGTILGQAVSTGPNASDDTTFTVTVSSPVSLAYVKAHLNLSGITADDPELRDVIAAAVDLAEDFIGPITPRTVTETQLSDGTSTLTLNRYPVLSVQSVTTSSGLTFSATPSPGGFYYLLRGGTLDLFTSYGLGWIPEFSQINYNSGFVSITVNYTAGRASLRPARQLAIAELVRHLWSTQQGSRSRQTQPDEWVPSGATTRFAMELFGKDVHRGIG
jgi:hypothetical protein